MAQKQPVAPTPAAAEPVAMLKTRLAIGLVGLVVAFYGGWLFVHRQDFTQLKSALIYVVGGLIGHDGVIAAASILLGVVVVRLVPAVARGPLTVGLVVLGSVTLLAVPMLGGFGAESDNPTLLNRNYTAGWVVLAVLVAIGVAIGIAANVRRSRPTSGGHAGDADAPSDED